MAHSDRRDGTRDTNPDLCFVSEDEHENVLPTYRLILNNFPQSQHHPALMKISLEVPIVDSLPRPRWNFNEADWIAYKQQMDANA